jgi:hypothetical protein
MRLLDWLFGKKDGMGAATLSGKQKPVPVGTTPHRSQRAPDLTDGKLGPTGHRDSEKAVPSAADNLKRWRESGHARAWVEKRHGWWNHNDWLALVEELRCSPFWPMETDAVGLVLEEEKRHWLQRN